MAYLPPFAAMYERKHKRGILHQFLVLLPLNALYGTNYVATLVRFCRTVQHNNNNKRKHMKNFFYIPSKQGFAFVFEEAWEAKLNVYKIEPSGLELFPNDLQLCNSISNLCGDKSRPLIINAAGYDSIVYIEGAKFNFLEVMYTEETHQKIKLCISYKQENSLYGKYPFLPVYDLPKLFEQNGWKLTEKKLFEMERMINAFIRRLRSSKRDIPDFKLII